MSASEQTSASKREPGYYWVTVGIFETIAEWVPDNGPRGGYWAQPRGTGVFDSDMHEIDERRIERPSPQQQPDKCPQCNGNGGGFTDNGWEACQPDELSKAQERQLVSLQKVTDEWHETDERIGFGQFVFKYYDVCRRLEDPKP